MFRSSLTRWVAGTLALIAVLAVLRFKPWQRIGGGSLALARAQLNVGFLPVT